MRAIKIDSTNRTVTEVEHEGDFRDIQKAIGCRCFTLIRDAGSQRDDLFVDDEGLLDASRDTKFFKIPWYPTPLAGNGLVLGSNSQGESIAAKGSLEEWQRNVRFMSAEAAWLQEELKESGWPSVSVYSFDLPEVPTTDDN